jgi:Zn-dependent protease
MTSQTRLAEAPRARSDIEWRHMRDGRVIVTADGSAHLSLSADELAFLLALDGSTPLSELPEGESDDVVGLLGDFADAGLLEGTAAVVDTGITFTRTGVEFSGFRRFVGAIYERGGRLVLTKPGLLLTLVVVAIGLVGLMITGGDTLSDHSHFSGAVVVLALSVSGIVASVIHETAHALVIHHHGRRVGSAGMGIYWGALSFYVDATDALLLPKKARLWQGSAGPAADALVSSFLTILALALPVGSPWSPLLLQVSVLGWIDVVLNLCPILELDGYWAVADALNRPHLRAESYGAMRRSSPAENHRLFPWRCLGWPASSPALC